MIGLDTNVIIRYIMQDDPKQAQQAARFIENAIKQGESLWISQITLCEMVWVLLKAYELTKEDILIVFKQLLRTRQMEIEHDSVAKAAIKDYEENNRVEFSDCLIGRQNALNECISTYTFDKNAAKLPTFKAVP